MQNAQHQNLVGFIWNIANKLRGPYRPPQYRRVMLLEGICPALGAGVLESRKDIDEDLGQQIIGVLKDMEAGRVELTDGPDGELAIVATAGSAA